MTETFGQFGIHFQEVLVTELLYDTQWATQMSEVINFEYFDVKHLQFLASRYFTYSQKHKVFPTLPMLVTIVKDELKAQREIDTVLRDQVVDFLQRARASRNLQDAPFVKEKSLEFCRAQAFKGALEHSIDLMQTRKYDEAVELMRKASMVGTTPSIGHNFMEDLEARFSVENRRTVPTGIPELDRKEILDGGLANGELGCVVAATGVGKSHFLVQLGAHAIKMRKNVVHYTMELSETKVGTRYDSHICEIDSTYIMEHKEKIKKHYQETKLGSLHIKYYPTMTVTVGAIRAHIDRLTAHGNKPDLIIIDYADIIRSARQYEAPRFELKAVYEELRGLAGELQVPIWTACQSNKDGAESEFVGLGNMAEAYSKAGTADVVLTISRKSTEKALGVGRLFIAKNRAGVDGLVYPIAIDTAQSRFAVKGEVMLPDDARAETEKDMKAQLKARWEELKRDQSLKMEQ